MTTALAVTNLTKRFGGLAVSEGVSVTLDEGEIHAVIGPNGAGKTTLVKQIAGEVAPDAGTIHLYDRDVTHLPVHRRASLGLGRTFQITCLLEGFTALENVATALQARSGSSLRFFRPVSADRSLAEGARAILNDVGLGERADHMAATLSHGEHRKLELAVALATEPKVLLLDEPLAGTGPEEVAPLVDLLSGLKARVPLLLIDHDMHAVFSLADRVSVLVAGKVIASGAPEAVRGDPAVRAAYLGDEEIVVARADA